MSGDNSGFHNGAGGVTDIHWVESRDAAKYPPMSIMLKCRNPNLCRKSHGIQKNITRPTKWVSKVAGYNTAIQKPTDFPY